MAPTGNWLVVERLLTTSLYHIVRFVFAVVQRIYWELSGTARQLRAARLPDNYHQSAQVLDIVWFHKFCFAQMTHVGNFVCTHNRFDSPQYIIDNDDVTLLTITDHDAIFCEPRQRGQHLWSGKYSPFIYYAQENYCGRLIVVPLSSFHRMAADIGDPKGQLIFLFNTARCGSTLLSQIMEHTGRCVTVCEPNSPNIVANKYRKYGDSAPLRQLARDVMRWECRPYQTMQPAPLGYFVKLIATSTVALPVFRELFPQSRCLFMYRDIMAVARSFYRMSMVVPTLRIGFILGKFSGRLTQFMVDQMGFEGVDYRVRLDSDLMPGVLLSAVTTMSYLDMRRRGFDVSALRYEDLLARPLDMCRIVLDYCRLPVSLADLAVKAFDVDAHENTPTAKSVLRQFEAPALTRRTKQKLDELLTKYGMPLVDEPSVFPGTLVYSQ